MFDFNGMFGRIEPGKCRLSVNGGIAIKTSAGYKTYDLEKNRLTNVSNFVFNGTDNFFFVLPTNKVSPGDIIIVNKKPCCVVKGDKNEITVISYEDAERKTIIPERHFFMGSAYYYGKIVSLLGNMGFGKKGKDGGMANVLKMMMMSEMMKGGANPMAALTGGIPAGDNNNNMFSTMMMMNMMNGGSGTGMGMFDNLFDGFFDENEEAAEDTAEITENNEE